MTAKARRGRSRRGAKPARIDPMIGLEHEVLIETIGSSGDGVVQIEGKPVFVPLALPGDHLRIRLCSKRGDGYAAEILKTYETTERVTPSERAAPACRHFGQCGGCQLQHLPEHAYIRWQIEQIQTALAKRGLADTPIRPLIPGHPATRRRLRVASGDRRDLGRRHAGHGAKSTQGRPALGFRARQSREIVSIEQCPVALPALIALFPPLRNLLGTLDLASQGCELHMTATDSGVDLLLEAATPPNLADLEALAAFADQNDLARLACRPDDRSPAEPIAIRRPATVSMGGVPVDLPIGAFLQATEQAENAIRDTVREAIGPSPRLADLFAGCGAFGLPLAAEGRQVIAIERDPAMVDALKAAARHAGITRLKAEPRDLDRQPLDLTELDQLDAAIVDPPRAGARTQVQALAMSRVPKIAMVSCNPQTFARDARILTDGGYRLAWVQPIDAFLWSAQIELAAAFTR